MQPGYWLKTLNIAISATIVFPEPVGAPNSTLWSLWYKQWNICVCIGLKWLKLYSISYDGFPSAVTGNGCSSKRSEHTYIPLRAFGYKNYLLWVNCVFLMEHDTVTALCLILNTLKKMTRCSKLVLQVIRTFGYKHYILWVNWVFFNVTRQVTELCHISNTLAKKFDEAYKTSFASKLSIEIIYAFFFKR